MHERRSRKKEITRRILVYTIMTLTMLALLVVLTYRILGYQFNFSTRTIERTGLVQYDSFPRGAWVQVDGKRYEQTRTKNSVLPGVRQFSMRLNGYHDWQKTLSIEAGTVTWLSYARLVPVEKNIVEAGTMGQLESIQQSPDRRYMFGVRTGSDGSLESVLVDVRDSRQPKTTVSLLPTETLTGFSEGSDATQHELSVVRWDNASRHVLLKHVYTGTVHGNEWLWVDRENPEAVVNLSTLTNLAVTDVQPGKDGEVYILQENGDVRRLTISNGTMSRPLLAGVSSFGMYNASTMYYAGIQNEKSIVGVWRDSWTVPTIIRTSAGQEPPRIAVSNYFYQDTVAVSDGATVTIYRGTLPTSVRDKETLIENVFATFTLNRPIERLTISSNGRFIVAEDEQGFVTYDLELKSVSQQSQKHNGSNIQWLDEYHIWRVNNTGMLLMQEFDGVNSYELMPIDGRYTALLTHDGRYVYGFIRGEDGNVTLQRLSMTVDS